MNLLRAFLFNAAFYLWTAAIGLVGLPVLLLPRRLNMRFGTMWSRVTLHLLAWTVGLTHEVRGEATDVRSDLYAIGCLIYEMLSGRPPIAPADARKAILQRHLDRAPAPLSSLVPSVPPALAEIVARLLARDPPARFSSTAALEAALVGLHAANAALPGISRAVADRESRSTLLPLDRAVVSPTVDWRRRAARARSSRRPSSLIAWV